MKSMLATAAMATSLLLTGCVAQVVASAPTSTETPTPSAATTSTPTPQPAPTASPFTAVDPAGFAVDGWEGVHFISPSRNLRCGITRNITAPAGLMWGCIAREANWEFSRSDPTDYCFGSQVTCGDGIVGLEDEIPHPWAHGDPAIPANQATGGSEPGLYEIATLQYGESVTYGGVTCTSEQVHITCTNATSGHGFIISRDENTIF